MANKWTDPQVKLPKDKQDVLIVTKAQSIYPVVAYFTDYDNTFRVWGTRKEEDGRVVVVCSGQPDIAVDDVLYWHPIPQTIPGGGKIY